MRQDSVTLRVIIKPGPERRGDQTIAIGPGPITLREFAGLPEVRKELQPGWTETSLVLLNGRPVSTLKGLDTVIRANDTISVLRPLSGG